MKKFLIALVASVFIFSIFDYKVLADAGEVDLSDEEVGTYALKPKYAYTTAGYTFTIGNLGTGHVDFAVDGNLYYNANNGNYVTHDLAPWMTYHAETIPSASGSVSASVYGWTIYPSGSHFYMTVTMKYVINGNTYYSSSNAIYLNITI